jgi:hypothetical protein
MYTDSQYKTHYMYVRLVIHNLRAASLDAQLRSAILVP